MKQILLFITILLTFYEPEIIAQNTQILISQAVRNSFTRVGVTDARVTVMDKRGQIIDTLRTDPKMGIWTLNVPRKPTTFRIRVEHPQYETGEMMVNMNHPARIYNFKMPDMLLKIKADKQLGEAVVRATRVKLYYRGDTIVVNASAFKLPEGSMLEGLVRSVPGCEMRENGDIYMNGKKVDYLMLNGKEFFKGNNRIMLDNLPYYTVDKLEFYNQDSELSQLTGRSHGEQDYVMNVKMKKEYSIGYLGNLEGAGGTRERWLGRAFGVRFTDNSRLTLFANINNVNENRSPGRDGDWSSANAPTGETRLYNVGGELMIDDKYGRYRETANAVFNYRRSLNETHTATESFLPSGSVFSRAQQTDRRHGFDLNATNHLTLKRIGLISDTRFNYRKEDTRTESRTGQFSQSPAAYGSTVAVLDSLFSATPGQLMRMAVNRTRTTAEGYDHQLTVSQKFDFRKELPWGDDLILGASAEWTDGSGRLTDHYLQDLLGSNPATEQQDRLQRQFRRGYDVMAKAGYTIHLLNGWHFTLEDAFHQRLQKTGSHLYRLDWDEHFAGGEVLPSAADYARLLDRDNSWNSDNLYRANETRLLAAYNKQDNERGRNTSFSLNLPIFYTWTTEHYLRSDRATDVTDCRWIFRPNLNLEYNTRHWRDLYQLNYSMDMRGPDLTQKVDFTDTSNPLQILRGNPNLKPSMSHHVNLLVHSRLNGNAHHLTWNSQFNILRDLMAQSVSYEPLTGVYTYQPVNINGNWNTQHSLRYHRKLDRKSRFSMDVSTQFGYYRSVDLKTDGTMGEPHRSRVDQYLPTEALTLHYEYQTWKVSLSGQVSWNNIYPQDTPEDAIHSLDYHYGLALQCQLPLKLQLATDLNMYSRRGYTDSSLNTDNLVWNAQISRSLCKGRLNLMLKAYDLLHQISQTMTTVNSQGRVETWRLSLPNYVMLHVQWKFHKSPKKRP